MNDIPKTSKAAGYPSNDWQATAERLFDCSAKMERGIHEGLKKVRERAAEHTGPEYSDYTAGLNDALRIVESVLANKEINQ